MNSMGCVFLLIVMSTSAFAMGEIMSLVGSTGRLVSGMVRVPVSYCQSEGHHQNYVNGHRKNYDSDEIERELNELQRVDTLLNGNSAKTSAADLYDQLVKDLEELDKEDYLLNVSLPPLGKVYRGIDGAFYCRKEPKFFDPSQSRDS